MRQKLGRQRGLETSATRLVRADPLLTSLTAHGELKGLQNEVGEWVYKVPSKNLFSKFFSSTLIEVLEEVGQKHLGLRSIFLDMKIPHVFWLPRGVVSLNLGCFLYAAENRRGHLTGHTLPCISHHRSSFKNKTCVSTIQAFSLLRTFRNQCNKVRPTDSLLPNQLI